VCATFRWIKFNKVECHRETAQHILPESHKLIDAGDLLLCLVNIPEALVLYTYKEESPAVIDKPRDACVSVARFMYE